MRKRAARTNTVSGPMETLRPLKDVLKDILGSFGSRGIVGVQGYSITVRTEKSSLNMNWGDLKIRKREVPSVEP
jgi:hypothetical protein